MKPNRLLFVVLFLFGSVHGAVAAGPEDSVVCVFASLRLPNPTRPWAKQNPVQVMGTGVVIDGKTVLTNAACRRVRQRGLHSGPPWRRPRPGEGHLDGARNRPGHAGP